MNALIYTLKLEEPLLATQPFSGEPNSATSYSFIPGSMIRGALVGAYLNSQRGSGSGIDEDTLLDDELARRCFFDGGITFLNAYPEDPDSEARMLPTPGSWFVAKEDVEDENSTIHNFAAQIEESLAKPKAPQGEFCQLEAGVATLLDPVRQVTVHNASEDRSRKTAGLSQLFRYDALAAGQRFKGIILGDSLADLEQLRLLLAEWVVALGGSQSAGYGLVEVLEPTIDPGWNGEYEAEPATGSSVTLTLLSDAILRPAGQSLLAALAATLGVSDQDLNGFQDVRVIGGFNRKWGLPLPEAQALRAGSVFLLPAAAVDPDGLADLVKSGIGERRIDGFGRLAVNWHTQPTYQRQPAQERLRDPAPALRPAGQKLATRMANQLLRRQLEQTLVDKIVGYRGQFKNPPSITQLSRVRVAARHAILSGDLKPIETHLESLKLARRQWDDARLGQASLYDWIISQCQSSADHFKETFSLTGRLPQVAGQASDLPAAVQREYQARLIDGVMKQAIENLKAKAASPQTGGQS